MALVNVVDNKSGGQQVFRAKAAVNFASINAVVSGTVSVTITGVLLGDLVYVTQTATLTTGLVMDCMALVSAADTVVCRATNVTAAPIDEASQVMDFLIVRNNVPL